MYLNPQWRILTVGDGDLSFSNAIYTHLSPKALVASTYDDQATIEQKYQHNALSNLKAHNVEVLNGFDVTNPACWQTLSQNQHSFDVVIFQFPLIPAFVGREAFENNTRQTSMDVKPYREWNIEGSLNNGLNADYLGQIPFDISHFEGYKIRNVDRDKHVKDTSGITYVFSQKGINTHTSELSSRLTKPAYLTPNHCPLCRVGPYMASEDEIKHLNAKKHQQMLHLESDWQQWLNEFYR